MQVCRFRTAFTTVSPPSAERKQTISTVFPFLKLLQSGAISSRYPQWGRCYTTPPAPYVHSDPWVGQFIQTLFFHTDKRRGKRRV